MSGSLWIERLYDCLVPAVCATVREVDRVCVWLLGACVCRLPACSDCCVYEHGWM